MMRRRCLTRGHKMGSFMPVAPYLFCRRWGCDASAVGTPLPGGGIETAVAMHNAIPRAVRVPPVELAVVDGRAVSVEEWAEGKP
jgi:hypothetical protein